MMCACWPWVWCTWAAHTWAGDTLSSAAWMAAVTALVLVASPVVLRGKVRAAVAVPALARRRP